MYIWINWGYIFYHTYRAKGHIFELRFYNPLKEDINTLVVRIYRLQNVVRPYYDLYHETRLYCAPSISSK